MKQSQYARIEKLLTRKAGATALDIIALAGTVCPHKRLSDLKARGWTIWREEIKGKSYGRYRGTAPQA